MTLTPNGSNATPKRDYGSPPALIAAARSLLGRIDLDPASSTSCNRRVKAKRWWGDTQNGEAWTDGLTQRWTGRVFLNPPGGLGGSAKRWWRKLVAEYDECHVSAAVFVCFSIDALQWSQSCNAGGVLAFPIWIPAKRLAYLDHVTGIVDGSPPKPSAIVWLPPKGLTRTEMRDQLTGTFTIQPEKIPGVAVIPPLRRGLR